MRKHLPARPTPPSAEAVARVRSRTVESLEDKENTASDDTPAETGGKGSHIRSHTAVGIKKGLRRGLEQAVTYIYNLSVSKVNGMLW